MASTYSTALRLELMATGDQSGTWGDTTNTNLGTLLEQAITGYLSVAQGDVANLTLTTNNGATDQSRNMVVNLTGAMTAARNVVVPTANKLYLVKNSTTGGFAVTVKTAAGTGVTVPATTARWVYCDGTNVVDGLSGPWAPSANDAQALGLSGTAWADLFLASGAVIDFNAGNFTLTHSAGLLTANGTIASTGSSAGFTAFQAVSTEAAAAAGPIIELYRNSASPAANDILGQIIFYGQDSGPAKQEYGSIQAVVADTTAASEDSTLDIYATVAGARALGISVGPALAISTNSSNVTTAPGLAFIGDLNTGLGSSGADTLDIVTGGVDRARVSSTGAWSATIPSGSTLYPAFFARAFVAYNASSGTPTIGASGNVTSLTDNGVGDATVNFTTVMPDANYTAVGGSGTGASDNRAMVANYNAAPSTSACRVRTQVPSTGAATDDQYSSIVFVR